MKLFGRALDYDFAVDAPEPAASVLAPVLAGLRIEPSLQLDRRDIAMVEQASGHWSLVIEGDELRPEPRGRLMAHLLEHINRCAAASLSNGVPLHAAAVADSQNRVVPLVGASGAGKSTLAAAATLRGWAYVADEITAVDPMDLSARPYHRPIGLRRGGARAVGIDYPDDPWFDDVFPWIVPIEARRAEGTVMGLVIVRCHADRTDVTEVDPARALVELMEQTVVPEDRLLVPAFRRLEQLVRQVPVVRLSYRTPVEGIEALTSTTRSWVGDS